MANNAYNPVMDQDVLRTLIAAEIKRATAPLEAEIQWLKAEVQSLKAGPSSAAVSGPTVSPVISSEPPPVWNPEPVPEATITTEEPVSSLPVNVPPDRSDFARFLARGLEQEAKEYAEERPEPEKKKGWNPFKK
jgi:uncharacterized small protein (DUF1192 family)